LRSKKVSDKGEKMSHLHELAKFSTEELQAEIEKRNGRPKPKENINWLKVLEHCQSYIFYIEEYGYSPDTEVHYRLFKLVMEEIYGNNVWHWISDHIE
jgi:hypothetical protein